MVGFLSTFVEVIAKIRGKIPNYQVGKGGQL